MRFTELIGTQDDYIEHVVITPKYHPCPKCGRQGKRKHTTTRSVRHLCVLYRRCWIVAEVGVYKARCECCQYFQAHIPGVPPRGRYSYEVRNVIANALIRDRVPYTLVQLRMLERKKGTDLFFALKNKSDNHVEGSSIERYSLMSQSDSSAATPMRRRTCHYTLRLTFMGITT